MDHSPYRILGVAKNAMPEEIKKAYRSLAKKYHPDANPGNQQAKQRFEEIGSAYAVLMDDEKRKALDREESASQGTGRQTKSGNRSRQMGNMERPLRKSPSDQKKTAADTSVNMKDAKKQFEKFFGFRP